MANYKVNGWQDVKNDLFFPVEEFPLAYNNDGEINEVPNKAIVRTDTGEMLSVVGPDYQLVPNETVFTELYKVLPSTGDVTVKNAWTTHNGGRSFIELILDNGHGGKILDAPVANRLIISNSYDRSRKFSIQAGLAVLVCTNGMIRWESRTELASFHLKSQDIYSRLGDVAKLLKVDLARTQIYTDYGLTNVIDAEAVIKQVSQAIRFPATYEEAVIKRAESSHKNYWDLYQCFTETITHDMDTPQRKLQYEFRLDREFEQVYKGSK